MAPVADSDGPAASTPPSYAQVFLRTDASAASTSADASSALAPRKLKVHLPTTLRDRPKLSSLLKRHGADVESSWRTSDVIVLDLAQPHAARHLFRQARSLSQPIPVVTEDWITDSVDQSALADVDNAKYNAIRRLDEKEAKAEAKKQSAAAAAASSSRTPYASLKPHQLPGRMGYTAVDRDMIVEHLCVTREPWSGFAVAKELEEISGGRHSAVSYQTHLRDNLTKNRRYRFLAEQRMRQKAREAEEAAAVAASVGADDVESAGAASEAASGSAAIGRSGQIGAKLAFHDKAPTARAKAEAKLAKQAEHDRRELLRKQQAEEQTEDEDEGEPEPIEEELPRGAEAAAEGEEERPSADVEEEEEREVDVSDSGEREADEVAQMLDAPGKVEGLQGQKGRGRNGHDEGSSRDIDEETEPVDGWDQTGELENGGEPDGEEVQEGTDQEQGSQDASDDSQSRSQPEKFTGEDRQTLGVYLSKLLSVSLEGGTVSEEEVSDLIRLSPEEAEGKQSVDVLHPPHSFFRELEREVSKHTAAAWKAHHAKNRITYLELARALRNFSQSQSQGPSQGATQEGSDEEAEEEEDEAEEIEDEEEEEEEEDAAQVQGEPQMRDASTEADEEQAQAEVDDEQSQEQVEDDDVVEAEAEAEADIPSEPPSTTKSQRTIHHDAKVARRSEIISAEEERLASVVSPTPARVLKDAATGMTQPLDAFGNSDESLPATNVGKRRQSAMELDSTPSKRPNFAKRARHTVAGGSPVAKAGGSPLRTVTRASKHAFVDFSGDVEDDDEQGRVDVDEMDEDAEEEVEREPRVVQRRTPVVSSPRASSSRGRQVGSPLVRPAASRASIEPSKKRIPLEALVPPSALGLGHGAATTRVSSASFGDAAAVSRSSPSGTKGVSAQQKVREWSIRSSADERGRSSSTSLRRSIGEGQASERGSASPVSFPRNGGKRHRRDEGESSADVSSSVAGDASTSRAADRLRAQVRAFINEYGLPSIASGLPYLLKANGDLASARRRMEAKLQRLGRTYGLDRERTLQFVREAKGNFDLAEGFLRLVRDEASRG